MRITCDKAALVIVDVQNDFCPGGTLSVPEGDRIVPVINNLMAWGFKRVVATQDWHPEDHISFASNHAGKKPFDTTILEGWDPPVEQVLWPAHCIQGKRGAELHRDLETRRIDAVIRKGMHRELDSYSAFFENDQTTPTGLSGYLESQDIDAVVLTGLAADVCVYYSALDALKLGMSVILVEDATRGIDTPEGSLEEKLVELESKGVSLLPSGDLEHR